MFVRLLKLKSNEFPENDPMERQDLLKAPHFEALALTEEELGMFVAAYRPQLRFSCLLIAKDEMQNYQSK